MSYKYNARAMVYNSRNIVRLWDVAYGKLFGHKFLLCVFLLRHFSQVAIMEERGPIL